MLCDNCVLLDENRCFTRTSYVRLKHNPSTLLLVGVSKKECISAIIFLNQRSSMAYRTKPAKPRLSAWDMFIIVQSRKQQLLEACTSAGLGVSKKEHCSARLRIIFSSQGSYRTKPAKPSLSACLLRHVYYSAIPQLYLLHRTSSK